MERMWIILIGVGVTCVLGAVAYVVYRFAFQKKSSKKLQVRMVPNATKSAKRIYGATADHAGLTIEKFEYRFTRITLAQDVKTSGTAFSDVTGTIELEIENDTGYNDFLWEQAKDDTTHFTDVMNPKAIKALIDAHPPAPAPVAVKDISYVLINYFRPLKIQATMTLPDGTTVRTHEGDSVVTHGDNEMNTGYTTMFGGDFSALTEASLATVVENNGGSWLKLAEPLVLNGSDTTLYLIYDPYLNVRVNHGSLAGPTSGVDALVDSKGTSWHVPPMTITPVVASGADKVYRSDFRVLLGLGYDILVYVYYTEETTVKAVNMGYIESEFDAAIDTAPMSPPQVFFIRRSGARWIFEDWEHKSILDGLSLTDAASKCTVGCMMQMCGSSVAPTEVDVKRLAHKQEIDFTAPPQRIR